MARKSHSASREENNSRHMGLWPILLKKSVDAAEPIFSASLVRF
jgi:hypothetical protein